MPEHGLSGMTIPPQYRSTEAFERYLGNPADPDSRVSFAAALELDEREEYPSEQNAQLDLWDVPEMYIPVEYGGRLKTFEEILALLRAVSRRDLTVALGHAITFLGALPVWIAGSEDQTRMVAELIRGRHKIAFALTEREHGADLLASEFEAHEEDDRLLVSGEKWLIGNATRATGLVLFARTRAAGGPRGFTLLFADKRLFDSAGFHHVPKVPTVGLRGSDLSGVHFENCAMPVTARIGPAGSGFELALKSLQISRILCTGFSLGAADTALRLAVDFALTRRLYGETVFDLPHTRATLVNAFIDLMICDCVAIGAVRAVQAWPAQASVWSSAAKYFVPSRMDNAIRDISVVLGARFFLRSSHAWSMFQKMARDSSIVSVFEGSTLVQLYALGLQLEQLTNAGQIPEEDLSRRLEAVFSLATPLPPFQAGQLRLFSRDGDDAVAGIPLMSNRIGATGASETLLNAVELIAQQYRQLATDIGQAHGLPGRSPALLELSRRYTHIHAAACCIGFWIHNREILGDFFGREEWLVNCLNRLSRGAFVEDAEVERELLERYREQRAFSAIPLQLATQGKQAANA